MALNPLYAAGPGRPVNLQGLIDPSIVGQQLQASTPEPAPAPKAPSVTPYQPTQMDRVTGAVQSFGANTDPNSVYAPEQFLGSAARGFAGVKNYLAALAGQHAEGQRQAQAADLERRNIESQIADRNRLQAAGTTAEYITDPQDATQEIQVDRDRQGNRVWARDPEGRPIRRKKAEGRRANSQGNVDFDNAAGLRKEFAQLVVPHQVIARAARAIENAVANPSAANDLSLIFSYMKILDPGSTVREGEFANASNAANVEERVRGIYNRIINGQRLTDAQRADFLKSARGLAESQREQSRQYVRRYSDLARYYGFDPSEVVSDPYDFGAESPGPRPEVNF